MLLVYFALKDECVVNNIMRLWCQEGGRKTLPLDWRSGLNILMLSGNGRSSARGILLDIRYILSTIVVSTFHCSNMNT